MTIEEINDRVQSIRVSAPDDYEKAHAEEDALRADFIRYVASLPNLRLADKAKAVLETTNIKFARWCA